MRRYGSALLGNGGASGSAVKRMGPAGESAKSLRESEVENDGDRLVKIKLQVTDDAEIANEKQVQQHPLLASTLRNGKSSSIVVGDDSFADVNGADGQRQEKAIARGLNSLPVSALGESKEALLSSESVGNAVGSAYDNVDSSFDDTGEFSLVLEALDLLLLLFETND